MANSCTDKNPAYNLKAELLIAGFFVNQPTPLPPHWLPPPPISRAAATEIFEEMNTLRCAATPHKSAGQLAEIYRERIIRTRRICIKAFERHHLLKRQTNERYDAKCWEGRPTAKQPPSAAHRKPHSHGAGAGGPTDQGGCDVQVVTDGKGALQLKQDHGFDLNALDTGRPDGGGFETFLCLRQVPALSATPMVFIARRSDEVNWRRAMELGVADRIEKPFGRPTLVRRILSHLKTSVHRSRLGR